MKLLRATARETLFSVDATGFNRLISFACWSTIFFSFLCWILINPHLPSGPICPYHLDESISNFRVSGVRFLFFIISRIDIPVSKQWRPWSDAAFCGSWSGTALFAYVPKPFLQLIKTQINLGIHAVRSTFLLNFDDWVECKISIA